MTRLRDALLRVKYVVTGVLVFVDEDGGNPERYRVGRWSAWNMLRPRTPYDEWARRAGTLPCGCSRSPITRRWLSFLGDCPEHGILPR